MKLDVPERAGLLSVLPDQGNILTLRIVNDLRMALGFTEEDIAEGGATELPDGMVRWEKDLVRDIPLGVKAQSWILERLEGLDKDGQMTPVLLGVYDKLQAVAKDAN